MLQGTQLPSGMDTVSVQAGEQPADKGGFGAPTFSSPQAVPAADGRGWGAASPADPLQLGTVCHRPSLGRARKTSSAPGQQQKQPPGRSLAAQDTQGRRGAGRKGDVCTTQGSVQAPAPSVVQEERRQECTCIPGALRHNLVHLVGLGDVQLAPLRHLLEVGALVEGTAETCLPGGGVSLVRPLVVLPLVDGPRLPERGCPVLQELPTPQPPALLSKGVTGIQVPWGWVGGSGEPWLCVLGDCRELGGGASEGDTQNWVGRSQRSTWT